ncbi:MAG: tetratricopeptide repeat protein [Hyphomicrobium sp.]|jgi:hypothetical protein|uniref:tetratricopeptide repeat protein n=1 Tax=Hyphomicrobium sp. TaxID=82 RepID=UPI0025C4047B|nr:tetratricopeptide repeat protein [Hyphomicrobium sp.]MBX9865140.1 tetratricopeptide repeat protein [Hyphomicrobium sp.]
MGFLDWLSRREKPRTGPYAEASFFHIPDRDYFGWYATSPDGGFTLTWRDANDEGTHGGARASGMGRYFLLAGDAIIAEGQIERPNDGKVASDGTFILNDWRFNSELGGAFCAFRADGSPIVSQRFTANLLNNGLSANGRLAVCQTCNSHTDDASVLAVFDLTQGREIVRWKPESGWAESYAFADDGQSIRLCYPGGASLAYSLDGRFLDRDLWIERSLGRGDLAVIQQLIDSEDKKPSAELARRLVAGIDVALKATSDDHICAWAYKLRGISLEAEKNWPEALRSYDLALGLDPKIGVKRRADALRKASNK